MAFEFSGIFIRTTIAIDIHKDFEFYTKPFNNPFDGIAVLVKQQSRPKTPESVVRGYLTQLGLQDADWLYIEYCTWAGTIDSVRSFGEKNGQPMQTFDDEKLKTVHQTFLSLMAEFGVNEGQALKFHPFSRGFWE